MVTTMLQNSEVVRIAYFAVGRNPPIVEAGVPTVVIAHGALRARNVVSNIGITL